MPVPLEVQDEKEIQLETAGLLLVDNGQIGTGTMGAFRWMN